MAQLVEQSLPIAEVCGSNPVIGKKNILNIYCQLYWKDENKEKEAGNGPFFYEINYALWRFRNNFSIILLQIENLEELLKEKDNQVEIARSKLSAVQAQTYSSEGALSSLEEALADRDKQVNKPLRSLYIKDSS